MGKLIPVLKSRDRETILANVLIMAHNPEDEAGRMVATQLLTKMAPTFGAELCE